MNALQEILYCSVLASDQPISVVSKILAEARARNGGQDITGLLVFDGLRFCQHFEGPRPIVLDLMSRLDGDPRHSDIRVVYEGPLEARRYQRFEMGFAQVDEGDDIALLHGMDGSEALERFLSLRARFDISG